MPLYYARISLQLRALATGSVDALLGASVPMNLLE
jgi:hypothetical protein